MAVIVLTNAHAPRFLFYLNSLGLSAQWLEKRLIIFALNSAAP
jgi:hypothetical protein